MRVLVVEGDARLRETMAMNLLLEGFNVDEAATVAEARAMLGASRYTAVVVDDPTGADAVMAIKETNPQLDVLALGARGTPRFTHTTHLPRPVAIVDVVRWLDSLMVRTLIAS